jgi:hypothetical protein
MPISLEHEGDNVYRVELAGILRKGDLDRCQEQVAREIDRIGPIRVLFILERFEGWERSGAWNDLSFYISHGDFIERIAIVGPARWRDETMMFAGADLRRAPVEFFQDDALATARRWLLM